MNVVKDATCGKMKSQEFVWRVELVDDYKWGSAGGSERDEGMKSCNFGWVCSRMY